MTTLTNTGEDGERMTEDEAVGWAKRFLTEASGYGRRPSERPGLVMTKAKEAQVRWDARMSLIAYALMWFEHQRRGKG